MLDGYKYQYKKGDWKAIMQPITNQLCEKYGLSVVPAEYVHSDERRTRQENEYQSSLKEVILADAEYCMANAEHVDEFIWNLRQLGYEVKDGKHIAVKAEGMKKFRRLDTWDGVIYQMRILQFTLTSSGSNDRMYINGIIG